MPISQITSASIANNVSVTFTAGSAAAPSVTTTGDTNTGIFFPAADTIAFAEGGAEVARFDSSGNLGIGTNSPNFSAFGGGGIQVTNGSYGTIRTTGSSASDMFVGSGGGGNWIWGQSNTPLIFATNSTDRMRIDSSGNLLVGTTSYAYPLSVVNTATSNRVGYFRADTASYTNAVLILDTPTSAGTSCRFIEAYSGSASLQFRVYNNGNVQNSNNSYGAISDVKLKENIVDATPKLDKLMQVKVRNYNLIGDELKQIGFVAQELEKVFPSLVDESQDTDKDGNDLGTTTKAVKYSVFVPMLIKAMQEQQAIITDLKARIETLEAK